MAKRKKAENETTEQVESVDVELETSTGDSTDSDKQSSARDENDVQGEDNAVLSLDNEPETVVETDTKSPQIDSEKDDLIPVEDVPIRDLPGFEIGSRLDPLNPHDVRYARQQLKRQRASK